MSTKSLTHWDAFETEQSAYQDVITEYLSSIGVSPDESLTCGETSRIWKFSTDRGLSLLFRLDMLDEPGKLIVNLEVCVGFMNERLDYQTSKFLLGFNRDLVDVKCAVSREGHLIGTFVCKVENLNLFHFRKIVSEMGDFGEYLRTTLGPYEIVPLKGLTE